MIDPFITTVHARSLPVYDLDAVRPLARRHGYKSSHADIVRFAVALAAAISLASDPVDIRTVLAGITRARPAEPPPATASLSPQEVLAKCSALQASLRPKNMTSRGSED